MKNMPVPVLAPLLLHGLLRGLTTPSHTTQLSPEPLDRLLQSPHRGGRINTTKTRGASLCLLGRLRPRKRVPELSHVVSVAGRTG